LKESNRELDNNLKEFQKEAGQKGLENQSLQENHSDLKAKNEELINQLKSTPSQDEIFSLKDSNPEMGKIGKKLQKHLKRKVLTLKD
jgi:hypothetical protein